MKCAVAGWLNKVVTRSEFTFQVDRFSSVQDFGFAALPQPAALLDFC